MSQSNIGLLEAIDMAMEAEMKASQFYTDAANRVQTPRGKDLLEQLADFEQNHYRKLGELKNSLNKNGEYIDYSGTQFKSERGNIPSEVAGKIESNTNEILEILNIAINAEDKAAKNYRKLADSTSDTRGKEMFNKLADEEVLHRRILSDEFFQFSNERSNWNWGD